MRNGVLNFVRDQWSRLQLRAFVFGRGLAAALFWTLAILGAAWLKASGLAALAVLLGVLWAGISLSAILFQLILIVDALLLAFIGKIVAYPVVLETLHEARVRRERAQAIGERSLWERLLYAVLYVADITCPLSAISTWCFIVLMRAPESTHVKTRPEAIAEMRRQVGREAELFEIAIGRLQAA